MSKKNQPVWQMLGMPEPEIVNGMWEYGRVYDPEVHGRPTVLANLRSDWHWGWHSYKLWGRKIRRQIRWEITRRRELRARS